ncbi:MAG: GNAT family N-acetyltransferase [Candidatus Hodarchaeota archaeon]
MYLLYGSRKKAWSLIGELLAALVSKQSHVLTGALYNWPLREKRGYSSLQRLSDIPGSQLQLITLRPNRTKSILGRTLDFAILDLERQFYPNDLGIIIETVRGGGFVVLRLPSVDQWSNIRTYQRDNLDYSISKTDIKPRFVSWLVKTLEVSDHCEFIDLEDPIQVSSVTLPVLQEIPFQHAESTKVHSSTLRVFPNQLFEVAKTNDQVKCLVAAEDLIINQKSSKNSLLAILANRGRGKSAVLGMIAAGFIFWARGKLNDTIRITISAPFLENAQEALRFAERCLSLLNVEIETQQDQRKNIYELRFSQGIIEFVPPGLCDTSPQHLLLIDEAGGIPPTLLKSIIKKATLTVLSSTVHGYEGVGRTFNAKFLSRIHKQPHYTLRKMTMSTPIRFPKDDPVEKWLFKTLLLDAEPPQSKKDIKTRKASDLTFFQLDRDQLFSLNSEKILRSVFGLFVHSHYRNQPNDMSIAADAPNYDICIVCLKKKQKFPLVAILVCWEGNLSNQTIESLDKHPDTQGNIIPLAFLRYHSKDLAKLKGLRIVRIATHPDRQSEGLGGYALEWLAKSATKMGADWIGSSFGVTTQLMRFWAAYGFQPMHIRPTASPTTGEYSIVVVKGISPKGQQAVELASSDFLIRFSELLQSVYNDLDPELVHQLLSSCSSIPDFPIRLTPSMRLRAWRYCWGQLYPVLALEALRELALWYFLCRPSVRLSRAQELILISRILQSQTWGKSMVKTHQKWIDAQGLLKKAIKRLLKAYESQ